MQALPSPKTTTQRVRDRAQKAREAPASSREIERLIATVNGRRLRLIERVK